MQKPRRKLILFDIDGTLVLYKDGVSYRIFERLAQEFFDRSISLTDYRFSGKTDKAIVYEVLTGNGIPEAAVAEREQEIFEWVPDEFAKCTSDDSLELLPNTRELLNAIDGTAVKALLTGNIERCAELKLGHFNLLHHFQFGVFGTESRDRNDLGVLALKKYATQFGEPIDPSDVVIIGDAVNDVQVAKHIGARCIITLTGRTTRDEVEPLAPDYIFNDLANTKEILDAINF